MTNGYGLFRWKVEMSLVLLFKKPNFGKPFQDLGKNLILRIFVKKEYYECDIRGQKVMMDYDLAKLYHVETKALKQAVRRNIERFPSDFMFTLTQEEHNSLIISSRSQFVTSDLEQRNRQTKYMPFAFTEQGVAMLASVLKSDIAIAANIAILRAFVHIREYLLSTSTLTSEVKELRARVDLLQLQNEENLGAVNDLSEDVRRADRCGETEG